MEANKIEVKLSGDLMCDACGNPMIVGRHGRHTTYSCCVPGCSRYDQVYRVVNWPVAVLTLVEEG